MSIHWNKVRALADAQPGVTGLYMRALRTAPAN